MNDLRLYSRICARTSGLQYKGWPLMMLQVLVVVLSEPIGVVLLISRFGVWVIGRPNASCYLRLAVTGFDWRTFAAVSTTSRGA